LGSHLVDRLLADGHTEIVVFDNLARGRLANLAQHAGNPSLRFVEGDVRDARAVKGALEGADVVHHLASRGNSVDLDINEIFSTNVVGTFNVLWSAVQQDVRRVLLTSTCQVYGPPITLPVDECHPLLPTSLYGASKMAAEALCRGLGETAGLRTTVVRLADVYGHRDIHGIIPQWLDRARAGQTLQLRGGKQVVDLVWVGQVVDALIRAATSDASSHAPINVASGTGTRLADLARRIVRLVGRHGLVELLPANAADTGRFVADVQRMRLLLGVEPLLDPLAKLPSLFDEPGRASIDTSVSLGVRTAADSSLPGLVG
jgi:nucleoside-diphosphate-sugar epimerase